MNTTYNVSTPATPTVTPPKTDKPMVLARLSARRKVLSDLIAKHGGKVPTVRTVQLWMKQAGYDCSLGTIYYDLRSLGLTAC